MQVVRLSITHFRGFGELVVHPRGHVALVGPPGCGRTDALEAISRVLDPESTRAPLTDDFDFHGRDTTNPIAIELVLGDLSDEIRQQFIYKTENWRTDTAAVVPDLEAAASGQVYPRVLRLAYRAKWSPRDEVAEQVVYFAKTSDPNQDQLDVVPRRDRQNLPFRRVTMNASPLGLGDRAEFRALVQRSSSDDLGEALDAIRGSLADVARTVTEAQQIREALDLVFEPITELTGLDGSAIRFTPSGGSSPQVLRSLAPDTEVGGLRLPLSRQGDAVPSIIAAAQSLAGIPRGEGIVLVDDLGEGIDARAAMHLAGLLANRAAQAWVSTRRAQVAATLGADALIRLTGEPGHRTAHQLAAQPDRTARISRRHYAGQLIPAADAHMVVIVEGPHDEEAYEAVSARMLEAGIPGCLTAARAVVVRPGGLDTGGGVSATVRLARLASELGFRTVIVLDGDTTSDQVHEAEAAADLVVRLPEGFAIERALVHGIEPSTAESILRGLITSFGVPVACPDEPLTLEQVRDLAVDVLKKRGKGLHAQFVAELERGALPPIAVQALQQATDGTPGGLRQLEA